MNSCTTTEFKAAFLDHLGDLTTPYSTNLTLMWSFEVINLYQLSKFDQILFRDGLIGILLFFKKFPTPEANTPPIAIHHSLKKYIPKAWQKRIRLYCLHTPERLTQHLVVTGFPNPNNISSLVTFLKKTKYETINFIVPTCQTSQLHLLYSNFSFIFNMYRQIFSLKKFSNIEIQNLDILREQKSLIHYNLYNLDNQYEIADDYYTHFLLSKNCSLVSVSSLTCPIYDEQLSAHHHIYLFANNSQTSLEDILQNDVSCNYIFKHKHNTWKTCIPINSDTYLYNQNMYHFCKQISKYAT